MSVRGLSNLIVTIMAAGEVEALPACDHRRLHEALAALETERNPVLDDLWLRFGGRRSWKEDPAVGRRADGVTAALWQAVSAGQLQVQEDGQYAAYHLTEDSATESRRQLMALPAPQAEALYATGAAWAAASTRRKNAAADCRSPATSRVVKRG